MSAATDSAGPLLAIDTATEVCSVALVHGANRALRREHVGQSHSQHVLGMVDAVLTETGIELGQCSAVAFGAGPGSFTGLRIACGVAQGLAWGVGRRVVPVGNLEALAEAARRQQPALDHVAVAIDARMHEAYWAVYRWRDGRWQAEVPPSLAPAAELAALLRARGAPVLCGNALEAFSQHLSEVPVQQRRHGLTADAGVIADLAVRAVARGETLPPEAALPLYVRDKVALTVAERAAARAAEAAT
jgi:tRNA threonylcarbamoyladenosine biosynthesis protein TsaB